MSSNKAIALVMSLSLLTTAAVAQNLVISNARIIVGTGQVIEKGTLVVKDGKIDSVGAPPAHSPSNKAIRIDAKGKTLIAGYIDVHRHLVPSPAEPFLTKDAADRMRELLEAGFTSVQSGGDDNAGILKLKQMIESSQIKGPRIFASARLPVSTMDSEEQVRAAIRAAKASGADSIAEVHYPAKEPPAPITAKETRNLLAALDEANKLGIPLQIHAVSPAAMVEAAAIGGKKLIHTPHNDWVTEAQADVIREDGAEVSSCTGFGPPVFDVFNHDNKPTFRDGKAWPQGVVSNEGQGREGGFLPINGRTLFDHGVSYAYCTDTTFNATAALNQELKTLNLVFSPLDIIKIMGPNSAKFLNHAQDLGTLEPGKTADILVLGGNPLVGYWNFMTPEVVIKAGVVMIDKRGQPNSGKPMDKPQT
jgi:imidazolonepropionase-like amidohydrolase